jgi:hypothetical protein
MRKVVVLVACFMMIGSVVMASPLMDFSQGKGSIDLTMRNTENSVEGVDFDSKYNFDGAVTFGLGNKWAVQYRYFQPESDNTYIFPGKYALKLETNEFNVLYKLDKNLAAFAGFANAKGTLTEAGWGSASSSTKDLWQLGLVGTAALGDKTTLWASVGAGSDLTNWEAGVGYAFSAKCEFNVSYREFKVNDLDGADVKAKGLGFGVTFKY